jgi:hypothetical protein
LERFVLGRYKPEDVVVGKTILELASYVDAGHTIYAHTGKQGIFTFRRFQPGKYIYEFEYVRPLDRAYYSSEDDNHTVETFLASIAWWHIDIPPRDEIDEEMEALTTQAVWSTVEEIWYIHEFLGA